MILLPAQIHAAAPRCPLPAIEANWPLIVQGLQTQGCDDLETETAAAGTVVVETAWTFEPVLEYDSGAMYDTGRLAARLGNTPGADGDGQRLKGRGFIQLTGTNNYRKYGEALGSAGIDLLADPDKALDPKVAALILALFFTFEGIPPLARARDWPGVRKRVNGGTNGLAPFEHFVTQILPAAA